MRETRFLDLFQGPKKIAGASHCKIICTAGQPGRAIGIFSPLKIPFKAALRSKRRPTADLGIERGQKLQCRKTIFRRWMVDGPRVPKINFPPLFLNSKISRVFLLFGCCYPAVLEGCQVEFQVKQFIRQIKGAPPLDLWGLLLRIKTILHFHCNWDFFCLGWEFNNH